ncbi:hypothetical protein [Kutzneria sp. CA-103260]|nr:hypothetical protein [Kutzneria sp. CA-103260]
MTSFRQSRIACGSVAAVKCESVFEKASSQLKSRSGLGYWR